LRFGATATLLENASPANMVEIIETYKATISFTAPTAYRAMLAAMHEGADLSSLRTAVSAGETLPAPVFEDWVGKTGKPILDGIGSTEMLHIFVSNRPGTVHYGTTGTPVPGYRARIIDEHGAEAAPGEVGELEVAGPTAAMFYWNNREKSRHTFAGEWTRTGDKFYLDAGGNYVHCGRTDDMLKVGGIWVSPSEVEAALIAHEQVLECAVIGCADENELIKPKAFIVLMPGIAPEPALSELLKNHVKARLAPYKYPRWIEFIDELPKTATGKIQRHVLRAREAAARG
jgi:benzoate-CoA ligase family protein